MPPPRPFTRRARLRPIRLACAGAALLAAATAARADAALAPVVIRGEALTGSQGTPATRTTLEAAEIRDAAVSQPQQLLARVPGLRVMGYGLGGVVDVIALRGFGAGGHGGDLGLVLDGIVLNEAISHADGYADLNVVIPLELERVDVVKGPASVLVGNYNRAGTIFLRTRGGGNAQLADVTVGSFGTADVQAAGGWSMPRGQLNLAAQAFTTGGARPQSGYDRTTLAGRYTVPLRAGSLSFSARAHAGRWDSAGYLTLAQFATDPQGKDPRVRDDGGRKDFRTARADLTHRLSEGTTLLASLYGTQQGYTRWFTRPVAPDAWRQREEDYDRSVLGAGLSLNGKHRLGATPLAWVAGLETTRESTRYDYQDNTGQRARVLPPTARQDRAYRFDTASAYAQAEADIAPWLRPSIGLRADRFSGGCSVRAPEIVGPTDPPCDVPLQAAHQVSPKLGVRSRVAPGLDLRASRNAGFQLANVRGLYAPTNATSPTTFVQHEVGAAWKATADLQLDLAVWRLDSAGEIRELPPGSGQFFNAGETRRRGWDLEVLWALGQAWTLTVAHGRAEGVIRANPDPRLVGRQVNGVPRTTSSARLAYGEDEGLGAWLGVNQVGRYFYDAAGLNLLAWAGYTTVDAGLTWRGQWSRTPVRARLSVANLADRTYATNAFQIGGQSLVAPGAPRAVTAGLQIDWR